MIEIRDLRKTYQTGDTEVKALDGISAVIEDGETVAVIGKSGSGKSTFLNALGGMDIPTSGSILVDGTDIVGQKEKQLAQYRLRKVGFVFQFFHLLPILTVRENLMLPLLIAQKEANSDYLARIIEILGLEEKLNVFPSQLSGGQKQRVAIGRAMIHKPSLLLADEPTGNLDSATAQEIMELLLQCADEFHQTLVIVTHDREVAAQCGRIIEIRDGKIVDGKEEI